MINFHLVPKNKKLFKSSNVRKWLKEAEKVLEDDLLKEKAEEKILEATFFGYPLVISKNGKIKVIKNFYKK